MDKSQYRLLSANEIDKFEGYDRDVAQNHIANVGCIIVDSTYGDPIDNEYDLEEIYQAIESTKMYESKNRKNMNRKEKINEEINPRLKGQIANRLMHKIQHNYKYLKSGKKTLIDICKEIHVSPGDRRELLRMANDIMNQYEDFRVSQYGFGMAGSDKEYKGGDDDIQTYGYDEDSMYESKKSTITLTESELRKVISESVKRVLKENQEFYVCGETVYGEGDHYWIGDRKDAKYCKKSSEGFSKGPFRTEEEALAWADKNGINVRGNSGENTQNNNGELGAKEQMRLKHVHAAINAIDAVLNDIQNDYNVEEGIDECYQSVHDARMLMTSVKYSLMGMGQEATNILFRTFGDEMAMRYLQF